MIDPNDPELMPLNQLKKTVPGRLPGRRIHSRTLYRWVHNGIRGKKLEAILVGGCWKTTPDAFRRFVTDSNSNQGNGPELSPNQSEKKQERRAKEANDELRRRGL